MSMAPKGERILALCDGGAPWPIMIARWNGEKWQSTDEGTVGKTWKVLGFRYLPPVGPILVFPPTCSFCGKAASEVEKLIAGPSVMICNECVGLCDEMIQSPASAMSARSGETAGLAPQDASAVPQADAQTVEPLSNKNTNRDG